MYERDIWPQLRNEFPSWSQQELVHEASKRWKRLTAEEREPYKELAEQDKKRYLNEIIAYRRDRWTLQYRKQAEKYENRLVELREQKAQMNDKKRRDHETATIPS
uniref:HMG box domain-containing protein n=1 Tax=Romanomermis culicivorax TaxID=13658 RepID=A0A915IGF1_ROMCU